MKVHVAAVRTGLDAAANREVAIATIRAAAADGARLVVLPEYAARFDPRGVGAELAESLETGFVPALREAARETGVTVIAGTAVPAEGDPVPWSTSGSAPGAWSPDDGSTHRGTPSEEDASAPRGARRDRTAARDGAPAGRAANVVVVVDEAGRLVAQYRKVHLYDAFGHRESDRLVAGPASAPPAVVDVDGLKVGVMTCYDLRFPEVARRLVDAGAEVLAVPAAWAAGEHKADHWETLLRARAVENTAYVLASAQQGSGVAGDSLVVDPEGVVLARGTAESNATGEVTREAVRAARRRNPSLENRRYAVVPAGAGDAAVVPAGAGDAAVGGGRPLWDRWLRIAWLAVVVLGLACAVLARPVGALFDLLLFGGAGPVADGAGRDYLEFVYRVLGAVILGWGLAIGALSSGPLRRRERWAWWAVVVSLAAWFVVDTGWSLVLGYVPNALLNSVLAVVFAIPLIGMRREVT